MTPSEITSINIACAERLGWTEIQIGFVGLESGKSLMSATTCLHGVIPGDEGKHEDDQSFIPIPNFHAHYDNAAELLAQKAKEMGYSIGINNHEGPYEVGFYYDVMAPWIEATAPTLPAAICAAFLKIPYEAKV